MNIKKNINIATQTSYKIGGVVDYLSSPKDIEELKEVIRWANHKNLKIFILGRGTNILVSDSGFRGLVLDSSKLDFMSWRDDEITCGAGVLLHSLVVESVKSGFWGFENLGGIPGSIGGGVVMNAGAFGTEISEKILSVSALNLNSLHIETFSKEELCFGYRTSFFKGREHEYIITEVKFRFEKSKNNVDTQEKLNDIIKKRKEKQPLSLPNCGSVFKRPKGNYAGALIENSGLKGYRVGGAMVSEQHANFIVNIDAATADDVRDVVADVQQKVYEKTEVKLEPELIFIGDFKRELL